MCISRYVNVSSAMCGVYTTCTNTNGSYTCSCLLGFDTYVAGVGCQDKNECLTLSCNDYDARVTTPTIYPNG